MKVYVIYAGTYSAKHIVGIYSSREKAQEYVDFVRKFDVNPDAAVSNPEEWELDKQTTSNNMVRVYYDYEKDEVSTYLFEGWENMKPQSPYYIDDGIAFELPATEELTNPALVKKIAQDTYALYRTEKEYFFK